MNSNEFTLRVTGELWLHVYPMKNTAMKSYHFNTTVETDGTVHLSGLPPQKEIEIVIMERGGSGDEMEAWLKDIRARHPFAKMSKEEILIRLRQTRETVWAERHES